MKIVSYLQTVQSHLEGASKDDLAHLDMRGFNVGISASRFDASELAHESFHAPAIRLSFLGAPRSKARANEQRRFDLAFAAFIVTESRDRVPAGIDLAEWVVGTLILWRPAGLIGVGLVQDLRIEALSSAEFERRSVDLHAVAWTVSCLLGQDEIDAGVHDPDARIVLPDGITFDLVAVDLPEGV